jgi:hypothetical protein
VPPLLSILPVILNLQVGYADETVQVVGSIIAPGKLETKLIVWYNES